MLKCQLDDEELVNKWNLDSLEVLTRSTKSVLYHWIPNIYLTFDQVGIQSNFTDGYSEDLLSSEG